MAQVENSLTITARVGGRHRRLATEKQLRAAIAKGELDRESNVRVERPGAEAQEMTADDVPELALLFDEMLGAKPAPPEREPEMQPQQVGDEPRRSMPLDAEGGSAPSPTTGPIQRTQPPVSDQTLFERAETSGAMTRNAPHRYGGNRPSEPSPVQYMLMPLQKYAQFDGRAPRAEYWWFQLALLVGIFGFAILLGGVLGEAAVGLAGLAWLGIIIPSLAVTVRRLHDIGMSGSWVIGLIIGSIIPIVNFLTFIVWFILMVLPGNRGQNRFGPDPLDPANAQAFS